MPSIYLQSSDAENFKVDVNAASKSITIKTMLEDIGLEGDNDEIPVPLPNVDGKTLKKVIEWCTKHKDVEDFLRIEKLSLGTDTDDTSEKKEEVSEDGWTPGKFKKLKTNSNLKFLIFFTVFYLHFYCNCCIFIVFLLQLWHLYCIFFAIIAFLLHFYCIFIAIIAFLLQ